MADERIEALRNDPEWSAAAKVIYDKGGIAHADKAAYLECVADPAATTDDHEDAECSECGSTFCAMVMYEVEARVHAHSQDFTYRLVCPYCWVRGNNDAANE